MFKEKVGIIFIDSIIYVERDTQKEFIIGETIKGEARIDLEIFFDKKIPPNLL